MVYTGKIKSGETIHKKNGTIVIEWGLSRRAPKGLWSANILDSEGNRIERLSGYLNKTDVKKDANTILAIN